MSFATLNSKSNLKLAWRRIATTKDARYKSYFRHLMEAYELSYEDNIIELYNKIKNGEYSPQLPVRIYYPKASGLQRPITLLCIEDQIVFQAIANLFAEKVRGRRQPLIGYSVFSNWLTNDSKSEFFMKDWKHGYYHLRRALKGKYKQGYSWVANFDLSAFYDTIPHQLLLKTIAPHSGNSQLTDFIANCLKTWSADSAAVQHTHGIPQGPIASDFLAECIMLPIDEKMHSSYIYMRYVDDIRILGQSELEVREALVELDVLCRERGLIPSSEKTMVVQINNEDQLVQNIPPILLYEELLSTSRIPIEEAERSISESISQNGNQIEIIDKSKFRYILFRSGPSEKILRTISKLWIHCSHQIDAFVSFLENYDRVDEIVDLCWRDINSNPYDFVRGESWKLLARMCTVDECRQLTDAAINAVKKKGCSATRIGAYKFLLRCEELGLGSYSKWMMYDDSALIQAISTQYILSILDNDVIRHLFQRSLPDTSLGLTVFLSRSNVSFEQIGYTPDNLSRIAHNVYFKAGIISNGRKIRGDVIGSKLSKRYKIPIWNKWRILFGEDYQHANSILAVAERLYKGYKSEWLARQDAFNDALFRSFQKFLNDKNVCGRISTANDNGTLIDYGNLINNGDFNRAYPQLADHLKMVHDRRSRLPNAHPYEKHTGKKAAPLKAKEQRIMFAHLVHRKLNFLEFLVV